MEEKRTKLQIGCMIAMGGVFVLFLVLYLVMSFRVECRINGEVFAVKRQGESTLFTGRLTHQKGTITMTPQGQTTTFAFDFSPQFQESYQVTLEEETTLTCQITDSFGEDTLETEEALVLPVTVTGSAGNVLLDAYYQDSWRGSFLGRRGQCPGRRMGHYHHYQRGHLGGLPAAPERPGSPGRRGQGPTTPGGTLGDVCPVHPVGRRAVPANRLPHGIFPFTALPVCAGPGALGPVSGSDAHQLGT